MVSQFLHLSKFIKMKKTAFSLMTASLFLATFLLSVSMNKSNAAVLPKDYQAYTAICPNGNIITVCGVGTSYCIPAGTCNPIK